MYRKLLGICIIAAVLLWMSGCGIPKAPIDLIHAPAIETSINEDQFSKIIRGLLPDGAHVVVTDRLKGNNGVLYGDVDGDGIDEALVVYEEKRTDDKALRAALLKQNNKEWRIVWKMAGSGYGIDYAGFADVTKDGAPDLILGWSLGAGENGMDIYEWKNNTLRLWGKKGYYGQFDLEKLL
ncbi:FG-GAP repeat domain-containing protein [Paenibacillus thalictri]|uniref:VCBS repeat-containing protein n=1 Tax=Paenibacillus thalictri TaxID=2527873 RepID=A0A4V6MSD3_9BACL|nr:VCBS repeat-containing protein [Paenibacillus thalictri]TBL71040.1 VCBS repeat-containing protein [Paenibacillus thalictri]